jgi:hypothetical protein
VDTLAPTVTAVVKAGQKLAKVLKGGLKATATCSEACTLKGTLTLDKKTAKKLKLATVVGSVTKSAAAGPTALTIKLTSKAKAKLGKLKKVSLTLTLTGADAAGNVGKAKATKVTLKR